MEAVVYSTFRNHLKDYMKKVNDEFEPLTVVNKNPDEDIVVISKSEWDSLQETLRLASEQGNCQIRSCGAWQKSELVRFNSMRLRGKQMLLKFTEDAWKDYCYWQSQDKKH